MNQTDIDKCVAETVRAWIHYHDGRPIVVSLMLRNVGTPPHSARLGRASMLECLINLLVTQRLLVCLVELVLMCSWLYALRHDVWCSTRQLGSA